MHTYAVGTFVAPSHSPHPWVTASCVSTCNTVGGRSGWVQHNHLLITAKGMQASELLCIGIIENTMLHAHLCRASGSCVRTALPMQELLHITSLLLVCPHGCLPGCRRAEAGFLLGLEHTTSPPPGVWTHHCIVQ
jgi:hypothetical protein